MIKYDELKELTSLQGHMIKAKLVVSTTPGYMLDLIKPMYEFKKLHPNVGVEIIENTNRGIIEGIQQQRFDIGLMVNFGDMLKNKKDVDFHLLTKSKVKVYVGNDSLLSYNGKVSLEDLQHHPFIPFRGDYTSSFIKNYSEQIGPLNILFESNSTEAILNAVSLGLGFTISHEFLMNKKEFITNQQIIAIDIIDPNQTLPLDVAFGWICSKNKYLTSISKTFLKRIESSFDYA